MPLHKSVWGPRDLLLHMSVWGASCLQWHCRRGPPTAILVRL